MKKVYLAGPDVFASNAIEIAEKYKTICVAHGFEPLHPADGVEQTAVGIYTANINLIKSADAVVANLSAFRGAETDSGTAFEIGYATALGLPVVGYLSEPTTVKEQVKKLYGPIYFDEEKEQWLDQNSCLVEDFDLAVNLMLGVSCDIVFGDILAAIIHLQRRWYD